MNSVVTPFLDIGRGVVIASNGYDPGWHMDLGGSESMNKTWNVLSNFIPVAGAEKAGASLTGKLLTKALARKIGTEAAELAVKGRLTDAAARQSLGIMGYSIVPKAVIGAGGALSANVPIQLQLGVQGHDSPAELRRRLTKSIPAAIAIGSGLPLAQSRLLKSSIFTKPAVRELGHAGIEVLGEVGNSMNNFISDPHRKGYQGWQTVLGDGVRDGLVKAVFQGSEPPVATAPRVSEQPRLGWDSMPTVQTRYERITSRAPARVGDVVSWTTGSGTHYGIVDHITSRHGLRVRKYGVKNTVGLHPADVYRVVFPALGQ